MGLYPWCQLTSIQLPPYSFLVMQLDFALRNCSIRNWLWLAAFPFIPSEHTWHAHVVAWAKGQELWQLQGASCFGTCFSCSNCMIASCICCSISIWALWTYFPIWIAKSKKSFTTSLIPCSRTRCSKSSIVATSSESCGNLAALDKFNVDTLPSKSHVKVL